VLFEAGRTGEAAVELARDLASREPAAVTLVSIAPQAPVLRGCLPSASDYNAAVRDAVIKELARAEETLWGLGSRAESRVLVEGKDPSLAELAATGGFDLVLLPARRWLLPGRGHPAAAQLRRASPAEVRVVYSDATKPG
jgi:hypothetical protein